MELIPTRLKERLPAGFSYPVGAEAISASLHEVPCYCDLELQFSWKDSFWAARYQEKLAALGKISIIVLRYFRGWTIQVNAVPRSHAKAARDLVAEQALPALALVLSSAPEEPEHLQWVASFDLSTNVLIVDDIQDRPERHSRRKFRAPVRSRSR